MSSEARETSMEKLIIEVAVNENQTKATNPNVPITPDEIAADARRCVDAGAAIIHFHARVPETGEARLGDAPLYAESIRRIQAGCDPIVYPSNPPSVTDPVARLAPIHALAKDPTVQVELAVIDMRTN